MAGVKYLDVLIDKDETIKSAMEMLDRTAAKTVYVVDKSLKLLGSVTDGDIRRCMLKGKGLDTSISEAMHKNPVYIYQSQMFQKKTKLIMQKFQVNSIPVLNNLDVVVDVIFLKNLITNSKKRIEKRNNIVFVLAGGMGERLEPFTKILPKPLVPVGDYPIIEKIMDSFSYHGFSKFILSIYYKGDMIKTYFSDEQVNRKYDEVRYVKESKPLGTIGSLALAADMIKDTFFISNSDIIIEEDLSKIFDFHKEKGAVLTAVGCVKNSEIPYGVLNMKEDGYLDGIEEKPKYTHVVNTGVYVAEPEIVNYINNGNKMDITNLMELLLKDNKKISIYPVFEHQWFDIGQWAEFERTKKYFQESINA